MTDRKTVVKVEELRAGDLIWLTPHDRICRVDGTSKTTHNGREAWMIKAHYCRDRDYEVYVGPGHMVWRRD